MERNAEQVSWTTVHLRIVDGTISYSNELQLGPLQQISLRKLAAIRPNKVRPAHVTLDKVKIS